jgi:nitrate reductase beta subunit
LNPACVASCPSGALYKREEDGIVLVDQERCRGWRYCVSGCPYKKVYFNWKTGRSEKCIFCYPRIEAGMPTLCAHSCVGRIRYVGVIFYDADKIHAAASADPPASLYRAHLDILLDPDDPEVARAANAQGISQNFIDAARKSPVFKLAKTWELALPLHPEFRTLPMVWYIPPLSPIAEQVEPTEQMDAVDRLRIPVTYLANLLTAGDEAHIRRVLKRLVALRRYMRSIRVENAVDEDILQQAGLTPQTAREMYQLLAIAKHEKRFVVPTRVSSDSMQTFRDQGACGFS